MPWSSSFSTFYFYEKPRQKSYCGVYLIAKQNIGKKCPLKYRVDLKHTFFYGSVIVRGVGVPQKSGDICKENKNMLPESKFRVQEYYKNGKYMFFTG